MTLQDQILKSAKPILAPNQKALSTLSLQDRDSLASSFGLSRRAVEIAALDLEVWPRRYLRNAGSLGVAGQKSLLQAKALLIGAGGLGGTIALLLARMGLGSLVIADGDSFSESNLNRQALSLESNLGSKKVRVAQAEMAKINAATEVEVFEGFVAEKELSTLIRGVQAAMDALDNMPSRWCTEPSPALPGRLRPSTRKTSDSAPSTGIPGIPPKKGSR
jgi:hypothetical protein